MKQKTTIKIKSKQIKIPGKRSVVVKYTKRNFEALADSVNAGMPMEEALETLQPQRKLGAVGEGYFWSKINKNRASTIRIKVTTINKLKNLKKVGFGKGMDEIINKLITRQEKYTNNEL